MSATYFLRNSAPTNLPVNPTGYFAAFFATNPVRGGNNAMGTTPGSGGAQSSYDFTVPVLAGSQQIGVAQYCTPPLAAQILPSAATFTCGHAESLFGVAAIAYSPTWQVYLINGATGAVRNTLIGSQGTGGINSTAAVAETTSFSTSPAIGSNVTVFAGDYLLLELGISDNASASQTYRIWDGGTTAIAVNNVGTADAQSFFSINGYTPILAPSTTSILYARNTQQHNGLGPTSHYMSSVVVFFSGTIQTSAKIATPAANTAAGGVALGPLLVSGAPSTSLFAQFVSDYLAAQTILAGNYTVGFAMSADQVTNHSLRVGLYLVSQAGVFKANIIDAAGGVVVGAVKAGAVNSITTSLSAAVAGLQWTSAAGDYLVLEIAGNAAAGCNITLYFDGTTPIAADNVAGVQDSQSFISTPQAITFALGGGGPVIASADPPGWPFPQIAIGR